MGATVPTMKQNRTDSVWTNLLVLTDVVSKWNKACFELLGLELVITWLVKVEKRSTEILHLLVRYANRVSREYLLVKQQQSFHTHMEPWGSFRQHQIALCFGTVICGPASKSVPFKYWQLDTWQVILGHKSSRQSTGMVTAKKTEKNTSCNIKWYEKTHPS